MPMLLLLCQMNTTRLGYYDTLSFRTNTLQTSFYSIIMLHVTCYARAIFVKSGHAVIQSSEGREDVHAVLLRQALVVCWMDYLLACLSI